MNIPPQLPSSFPQFYVLSMTTIWYGMLLWWGGHNSPSCVCALSMFVQPSVWWSEVRSRKALDSTCKHCSGVTETSLYCQHCTTTAQVQNSPMFAAMKKITPSQPKPAQGDVLVIIRLLWCSYDEVEHLGKYLKSQECTQVFVTTKPNVVTAVFLVWGFFWMRGLLLNWVHILSTLVRKYTWSPKKNNS